MHSVVLCLFLWIKLLCVSSASRGLPIYSSNGGHCALIEKPVIKADKANYCQGDIVTLSVAASTYTIRWFRDGAELMQYTNKADIQVTAQGKYTAAYTNDLAETEFSEEFDLLFFQKPYVIIQATSTIICNGDEIRLTAACEDAISFRWSTGEQTVSILAKQPGLYTVEVMNGAGCTNSTGLELKVFSKVIIDPLPDQIVCTLKGEEVTVTAPPGFDSYMWNGDASHSNTHVFRNPGEYKLIVSDVNGCTAATTFKIVAWCKEIVIPNTFSPNGDGINDSWNIGGLEFDNGVDISVYNRYGNLVYQHKGPFTTWDGKSGGSLLPSGVYYYIVNSINSSQPLKGTLTIIR